MPLAMFFNHWLPDRTLWRVGGEGTGCRKVNVTAVPRLLCLLVLERQRAAQLPSTCLLRSLHPVHGGGRKYPPATCNNVTSLRWLIREWERGLPQQKTHLKTIETTNRSLATLDTANILWVFMNSLALYTHADALKNSWKMELNISTCKKKMMQYSWTMLS